MDLVLLSHSVTHEAFVEHELTEVWLVVQHVREAVGGDTPYVGHDRKYTRDVSIFHGEHGHMDGGIHHLLDGVHGSHVGSARQVWRVEAQRVHIAGDGPFASAEHSRGEVDMSVHSVVFTVLKQKGQQQWDVHEGVVVDFQDVLHLRARFHHPPKPKQNLQCQVGVGVGEVPDHDITVLLALSGQSATGLHRRRFAQQKDEADGLGHFFVWPGVSFGHGSVRGPDGQPLEFGSASVTGQHENHQEGLQW